jgi:predicted enzyme related to lactoylglutathione lyase
MKHAISWFEIPTTNLNRATTFYETIFGISFSPLDMPNIQMRMFPVESMTESVGGALVYSGGFHLPSETHGPLVYLNGDPDLQLVLDKVEAAGGKILVPKTEISPDHGFMAVIIDTEGNRIALHSSPVG